MRCLTHSAIRPCDSCLPRVILLSTSNPLLIPHYSSSLPLPAYITPACCRFVLSFIMSQCTMRVAFANRTELQSWQNATAVSSRINSSASVDVSARQIN